MYSFVSDFSCSALCLWDLPRVVACNRRLYSLLCNVTEWEIRCNLYELYCFSSFQFIDIINNTISTFNIWAFNMSLGKRRTTILFDIYVREELPSYKAYVYWASVNTDIQFCRARHLFPHSEDHILNFVNIFSNHQGENINWSMWAMNCI